MKIVIQIFWILGDYITVVRKIFSDSDGFVSSISGKVGYCHWLKKISNCCIDTSVYEKCGLI